MINLRKKNSSFEIFLKIFFLLLLFCLQNHLLLRDFSIFLKFLNRNFSDQNSIEPNKQFDFYSIDSIILFKPNASIISYLNK